MGYLRAIIITSVVVQMTTLAMSDGSNSVININPLEQPYYIETNHTINDSDNKMIVYNIDTDICDSYEVNTYIEVNCRNHTENVKVILTSDINSSINTYVTFNNGKVNVYQDGMGKGYRLYNNNQIYKLTYLINKGVNKHYVSIMLDDELIVETYEVIGNIRYYDYFVVKAENNYGQFMLYQEIPDAPLPPTVVEDNQDIVNADVDDDGIVEEEEEEEDADNQPINIDPPIVDEIINNDEEIIENIVDEIFSDPNNNVNLDNNLGNSQESNNPDTIINNQISIPNDIIPNEPDNDIINKWGGIVLAIIAGGLILLLLWFTHKAKTID